ncbi:MAG: hypothetical protein L3J79_05980, partial [Candidatus Marinimicrobia bacterium]|nr:hypothetical protein [Candidatus Neomarinimicrobiota bacterium]
MDTAEDYLKRIASLNINRSGERRAPHKPLLVLVAIGKLLQGQHELAFDEVKSALGPLLDAYAPPVKTGRHQPELPYWHLRSDNVWEISNESLLTFQKAGFPRKKTLNSSSGHLPEPFRELLLADKSYLNKVIQIL